VQSGYSSCVEQSADQSQTSHSAAATNSTATAAAAQNTASAELNGVTGDGMSPNYDLYLVCSSNI